MIHVMLLAQEGTAQCLPESPSSSMGTACAVPSRLYCKTMTGIDHAIFVSTLVRVPDWRGGASMARLECLLYRA